MEKWQIKLRDFANSIGQPWSTKLEPPIVEEDEIKGGKQLFVKFMSDGGDLDKPQALAFKAQLDKLKIKYDYFDDRKFIFKGKDAKAVAKAFPYLVEEE